MGKSIEVSVHTPAGGKVRLKYFKDPYKAEQYREELEVAYSGRGSAVAEEVELDW